MIGFETQPLEITCWAVGKMGQIIGPVEPASVALMQTEDPDADFAVVLTFLLQGPSVRDTFDEAIIDIARNVRRKKIPAATMRREDTLSIAYTLTARYDS